MQPRAARNHQGGFSVLIVLILLILLVGVAMILLSTSRNDVFGATNERESAIAFYAAEAGIAHGKANMAKYPYSDGTKYSGLVNTSFTKVIDYQLPNGATVPAKYTVTYLNNADASDGGTDMDGMLVIHSEGEGPSNSRAVVETISGIRSQVRSGPGYCAQANPPPSCRGL